MSGGPMPYVLEMGPYFSVLEDLLGDPARRAKTLARLRAGDPLSDLVGLESNSLDGDQHDRNYRVDKLNRGWFGMTRPGGRWQKNLDAVPTGHWHGYQGDPEAIMRATLIRAIEVALGIDHGTDPATRSRFWPIDFYWICQGPFFQGWVTWLAPSRFDASGRVTVTFTTPAAEGHPVKEKITRPPAQAGARYRCPPDPDDWKASHGMWVVGHEDYDKIVLLSTQGTGLRRIAVPSVQWRRKRTDVVCVAPAEWEGGVLSEGRRYYVAPNP
jgi:hypothetical protein